MDIDEAPEEETEPAATSAWDDPDIDRDLAQPGISAWDDVELDLQIDTADLIVEDVAPADDRNLKLSVGDSCQAKWLRKRKLPADLVAAGEFEEALNLLRKRLGIVNATPLEPLFKEAYWATCTSLPSLPQAPSINLPLLSEGNAKVREIAPVTLFNHAYIVELAKEASKLTTLGKFNDALTYFRNALQCIPLSVANDSKEEQNLLEMIETCREYVNLCRMEVTRKSLDPTQVARNTELAAFLTSCKVQPHHQLLTLQLAMTTAFRAQNFVTAAAFAKRLLQSASSKPEVAQKARQVAAVCEQKASDAHNIQFDPKAPIEDLKLCTGSLTPIGPMDPVVKCPYCGSTYKKEYTGKLCDSCQLSEIGLNTLGIQLRPM